MIIGSLQELNLLVINRKQIEEFDDDYDNDDGNDDDDDDDYDDDDNNVFAKNLYTKFKVLCERNHVWQLAR